MKISEVVPFLERRADGWINAGSPALRKKAPPGSVRAPVGVQGPSEEECSRAGLVDDDSAPHVYIDALTQTLGSSLTLSTLLRSVQDQSLTYIMLHVAKPGPPLFATIDADASWGGKWRVADYEGLRDAMQNDQLHENGLVAVSVKDAFAAQERAASASSTEVDYA